MKIFWYNKGTKERNKQKMFETFKNERAYQWHDKGSREGTASCRRDTAKVKKERRVQKAMTPYEREAAA